MFVLSKTPAAFPRIVQRFGKKWCSSVAGTSGSVTTVDEDKTALSTSGPLTRFSKLKTGLIFATCEDFKSPLSQIAFAFRAGSRYETPENLGVTHLLRVGAGVGTEGVTTYLMQRELGRAGASLRVTTSRDLMVYEVTCRREQIEQVLPFVYEAMHRPAFRPPDRPHVNDLLRADLALYRGDPQRLLIEALHEAAYRGGTLAQSLYMPAHCVDSRGRHSPVHGADYNQPHNPHHHIDMIRP